MKNFMITALAGLLVACGQNSPKTSNLSPKNTKIEASLPALASEIISITRSGNLSGDTLIFIPCLASSADVWNGTTAEFQNYDIRMVQVAGFAGEPKFATEEAYTDAVAAAINEHLSKVGGKNTVLIGHSMGGFASLKAALRMIKI